MAKRLGQYLRDLRSAKGLTTRQVSSLVDCNYSFIARLELGERSPSLGLLWQVVKVLDGDFGQALFLLCLDSDVPEDVAYGATSRCHLGDSRLAVGAPIGSTKYEDT
jgi:transcriptional regulator with XRE-family HTH domain